MFFNYFFLLQVSAFNIVSGDDLADISKMWVILFILRISLMRLRGTTNAIVRSIRVERNNAKNILNNFRWRFLLNFYPYKCGLAPHCIRRSFKAEILSFRGKGWKFAFFIVHCKRERRERSRFLWRRRFVGKAFFARSCIFELAVEGLLKSDVL